MPEPCDNAQIINYLDNNTDCNVKVVPHGRFEHRRTPSAPSAQGPLIPDMAIRLLTIRSHQRGQPLRAPCVGRGL
eukprot:3013410-Pyramimonas_sp.AAC.1